MGTQGNWAPSEAEDLSEFMELLRRLKQESRLSYRQLEKRATAVGDILPRSSAAAMLSRNVVPRPDQLAAFVTACGEGERVAEWLEVRDRIAVRQPLAEKPTREPAGKAAREVPPSEPPRRSVAALAVATGVLVLATAGAWLLATGGEPEGSQGPVAASTPSPSSMSPTSSTPSAGAPMQMPPSGWIRIRPAAAPDLCVTDGRVRDRRYVPLVAVQRPCSDVAPQGTRLEPMGGNTYRIQWHHPDYGKGCLKALSEGAGAELLEPYDDCAQGSRFRLEPSDSCTDGRFVLRVDGQGCVGIKGSGTSEGTEAVMERCVGRGGQVFVIEPVS
ncbi:RICIN domain-containing protein [Streptomyces anulatus]|uniref:RICIN domain-containing protein n=1 Tax=Streptomyces anulatus TaxID=1892 RepID=UPI0035D6F72A